MHLKKWTLGLIAAGVISHPFANHKNEPRLQTYGRRQKPPLFVILLGIADGGSEGNFIQLSLRLGNKNFYGGNLRLEPDTINQELVKSAWEIARQIKRLLGANKVMFEIKNGLTDDLGHYSEPKKCDLCEIPVIAWFLVHFRKCLLDDKLCCSGKSKLECAV